MSFYIKITLPSGLLREVDRGKLENSSFGDGQEDERAMKRPWLSEGQIAYILIQAVGRRSARYAGRAGIGELPGRWQANDADMAIVLLAPSLANAATRN